MDEQLLRKSVIKFRDGAKQSRKMNKIQNIRALPIESLIMNISIEQKTAKKKMELKLNRHLNV